MNSVDVRRAWLGSGFAVAAVVMLALGFGSVAVLGNRTDVVRDSFRQPITRVEVDAGGADLTVRRGAAGEVVVEQRLSWFRQRPRPLVELAGGTLRVHTGQDPLLSEGWLPGVRRSLAYEISVPDGVVLDLRTGSGAVHLRDLRDDWRLSTRDGEVTGTGLRSGEVSLDSGSGDADLAFAGPPRSLAVTTATGDIAIAVPDGPYRIDVDTAGGLFLAIPDTPAADRWISARSGDGDVQVTYR